MSFASGAIAVSIFGGPKVESSTANPRALALGKGPRKRSDKLKTN